MRYKYGINQREGSTEALIGDWKELNTETYVCNVCLQNSFKIHFCTQIQTTKIAYLYICLKIFA